MDLNSSNDDSQTFMNNFNSYDDEIKEQMWNSWEFFFNHNPEERDDFDCKLKIKYFCYNIV